MVVLKATMSLGNPTDPKTIEMTDWLEENIGKKLEKWMISAYRHPNYNETHVYFSFVDEGAALLFKMRWG